MSDDRPTLIARITALIDARDRLVTDLLRTGADPEWVAQRACTDTWPTKAPAAGVLPPEFCWDPDATATTRDADYSWEPTAQPCLAHPWGEATGATCRETAPGHAHVFLGAPGDKNSEPTGHGGHR